MGFHRRVHWATDRAFCRVHIDVHCCGVYHNVRETSRRQVQLDSVQINRLSHISADSYFVAHNVYYVKYTVSQEIRSDWSRAQTQHET